MSVSVSIADSAPRPTFSAPPSIASHASARRRSDSLQRDCGEDPCIRSRVVRSSVARRRVFVRDVGTGRCGEQNGSSRRIRPTRRKGLHRRPREDSHRRSRYRNRATNDHAELHRLNLWRIPSFARRPNGRHPSGDGRARDPHPRARRWRTAPTRTVRDRQAAGTRELERLRRRHNAKKKSHFCNELKVLGALCNLRTGVAPRSRENPQPVRTAVPLVDPLRRRGRV